MARVLGPPRAARRLPDLPPEALLVHQVRAGIRGDAPAAGRPCALVCTAAHDPHGARPGSEPGLERGRWMSQAEVIDRIGGLGLPLVVVAGDDPLSQPAVRPLLARLVEVGLEVVLEAGMSPAVATVDPRVRRVVDLAAPSGAEAAADAPPHLSQLAPHDVVRFVLGGRADYAWARDRMAEHALAERCGVLMAARAGVLRPADLAAWILADRLPVRMRVRVEGIAGEPGAEGA